MPVTNHTLWCVVAFVFLILINNEAMKSLFLLALIKSWLIDKFNKTSI
jgi:hypothetical protein